MYGVGGLLTFSVLLLVDLIYLFFILYAIRVILYGIKFTLMAFHNPKQNSKMAILILTLFILYITGWVGRCTGCNKYYF